jgi:hypothetical protein
MDGSSSLVLIQTFREFPNVEVLPSGLVDEPKTSESPSKNTPKNVFAKSGRYSLECLKFQRGSYLDGATTEYGQRALPYPFALIL